MKKWDCNQNQARIFTFLTKNKVIWAFLVGYINIKYILKEFTYIIKVLIFLFNVILVNSFSSINSTYLIVGKALAVI